MVAKTVSERVAALRARRDALGLVRLELYVYPDELPVFRALVTKIKAKRHKRGKLDAPV